MHLRLHRKNRKEYRLWTSSLLANFYIRSLHYCYLIFSVIILKVKAPVGLLFTKHKDQLFVPSVPLTPREIVYIHPFLSIDWIEIIMYSSAFTPKSYVSFSDSAVITLLTDSIIGILLFYFQSFHTSSVEFHILVFTTKVYKY